MDEASNRPSDESSPTLETTSSLEALDDVDSTLRELYTELARDPDLADSRDLRLQTLRATRLDLGRRVGLEALALYRRGKLHPAAPIAASEASIEAPPEVAAEPPAPPEEILAEPEIAPEEPSAPVLAPVSAEELTAWKERLASSGFATPVPQARVTLAPWRGVLERLMRDLGAPRDLATELDAEVEALEGPLDAEDGRANL